MVYGLVKQHAGYVDVRSTPGSGTTVRVLLPEADAAASRSTPEGGTAQLRGSETILLAEDEDALRRARRVLEKHGYRVFEAANGAEALALYGEHESEIALIVADVVMPTLGGPQLLRELRQAGKSVKVLFTSGYTARDVQETKALDPGCRSWPSRGRSRSSSGGVREVLDQPASGDSRAGTSIAGDADRPAHPSTRRLTIARPSPLPLVVVLNRGSNTRGSASAGMPLPLSCTSIRTPARAPSRHRPARRASSARRCG